MALGMSVERFKKQPSNPYKTPNIAYAESIGGQLGDYADIMGRLRKTADAPNAAANSESMSRLRGLLDKMGTGPTDLNYQRSGEWDQSFKLLKDLATTGGLSETDQQNLRARGISPIRSVYANMQRNMDRQRSLQGGFSPNYNAASAKMAREGSEQIAQQVTNVNADIAKMVQEGKLKSAPELSRMAGSENELANKFRLENEANKSNWAKTQADILREMSSMEQTGSQNNLDALRSMTQLYGTNPGLVETFGGQVMQQGQLRNQAAQGRRNQRVQTLQALQRGM